MKQPQLRRFRENLRRLDRKIDLLKEGSCCPGVTLPQCHVLLEMETLKEATGTELSRRLGQDPSTLSRTIDGLVAIGLVRRTPHHKDRRVIRLSLTQQGKRVCDQMNRDNDGFFRKVFASIPGPEREAVLRSFEVFVSALVEEDFPPPERGKGSRKRKKTAGK